MLRINLRNLKTTLLILKKDENEGIYKVYYLQSDPLLETSNIEEVKEKYPNLTTDSRAKTAK